MKITNEQSRQIYELATAPNKKISNVEIGKKFGISERTVRYHVRRWEQELHTISRTNKKAAAAIATHAMNVSEEASHILAAVKGSIQEAREAGVSPEKLAPLYSNWIRSLELASELLGDLSRAPQVNVQVNQEFNEIKAVIIGELCANCRQKIKGRLHELAGK